MDSAAVEVTIHVSVEGRRVFADLVFVNVGGGVFHLHKVNAFDGGRIENDLFRITAGGKPVDYVGVLKKRRAPGPEDYVAIPEGSALKVHVEVSAAYAFPDGPQDCRIRYVAVNPSRDGEQVQQVRSGEVSFRVPSAGGPS